MYKLIISMCLIITFNATANDVLNVDRFVTKNVEFSFPNNKNIRAKASDFLLDNYVIMSNELGDRWAVLTLTNTSNGRRILEQDHVLALFANGDRANPIEFRLNFDGNETQSITVAFGENKFPLLSISTRVN